MAQGVRRGVVLIMVAAVLAVLAALATGFYTMTLSQSLSSTRYSDSVRASILAKGGIDWSVASLRQQCLLKGEDPADPWFTVDYPFGARKHISYPAMVGATPQTYSQAVANTAGTNSDRITVEVSDAASRINVNACDNLAVLLDNLCRVVGPPLVAADQDALLPRRWSVEGATVGLFDNAKNTGDTAANRDLYYWLYDSSGALVWDGNTLKGNGRPKVDANGIAVYGDGYAIAGYRARQGKFTNIEAVKQALTYVERNNNGTPDHPLEQLEIEVKFAAIRNYITIDSWVDTNTVCVGKFEWISDPDTSGVFNMAIDRDKSWIPDDPANDPNNVRGSLRGCYLYIVNGHGAGQVRRILTNGIDWIKIERFTDPQTSQSTGFSIPPGPTSSYMIVAAEDAQLANLAGTPVPGNYVNQPPLEGTLTFPQTDANGNFIDEPAIDYSLRPLCIHRAPINVNTASDKVLAALVMGLNVQQGHPQSIGTDIDLATARAAWMVADPQELEPYLLNGRGIKRIPASAGKLVLNTDLPAMPAAASAAGYDVRYINNFGNQGDPNFVVQGSFTLNEAQELAYRIIIARQFDKDFPYLDPATGNPSATNPTPGNDSYLRGSIKSWDDLYFRVVRPWDEKRVRDGWTDVNGNGLMDGWVDKNRNFVMEANEVDTYNIATRARLIMANVNPNTDILKFNPNIEWIDRWGRNFTEMEPVNIYPDPLNPTDLPLFLRYDAKQTAFGPPPGAPVTFGDPRSIGGIASPTGSSWAKAMLADFEAHRAGAYVTRGFRYKSDQMIDKTDLNRSTTELSFDSNGIFEIQSTGQVAGGNKLLAERKMQALVKIYDVWRETTQRQFCQGTIEAGPAMKTLFPAGMADSPGTTVNPGMGPRGTNFSGQIARDSVNTGAGRLPLVTLPEPLVPLTYRLTKTLIPGQPSLVPNLEVVDQTVARGQKRNAYGQVVQMDVPDVVANGVMPAGYDGQIVLATNTSAFDPRGNGALNAPAGQDADSFLVSFDGDLDTTTANGNGHEQAKVPRTPAGDGYKYRVVDTCSILGLLNDTLLDHDPAQTDMTKPGAIPNTYLWQTASPGNNSIIGQALRGLNNTNYWENAELRMGDLRTEGVFLSGPGVSGNDGTMKYLIGDPDKLQSPADDTWPDSAQNRGNFDLAGNPPVAGVRKGSESGEGLTVSMWIKPTWRHDDRRTHEFFNAANPGHCMNARCTLFTKWGRYVYGDIGASVGMSGNGRRANNLYMGVEGETWTHLDQDITIALHGGSSYVAYSPPPPQKESPGYRVQPFRWHFTGFRYNYWFYRRLTARYGEYGHWGVGDPVSDPKNPTANEICRLVNYVGRPFINTSTYPEDDAFNWISSANDDVPLWGVPAVPSRIWPYYMYTGMSLLQDSGLKDTNCHASEFIRFPDVGRSFNPSMGLPTWHRDTLGASNPSTFWTFPDDRGNAALKGSPIVDWTYDQLDKGGRTGQDVRWDWADPGTHLARQKNFWPPGSTKAIPKVFSINNLNFGEMIDNTNPNYHEWNAWIYRHMPEDGTYSVIDELKISKKDRMMQPAAAVLKNDRIVGTGGGSGVSGGEMRTSRYYLPPDPSNVAQCPVFTSQSMLKSLKGVALPSNETVTVARVTWTVFTPRFLHEYRVMPPGHKYQRMENYYTGNASEWGTVSGALQTPKQLPFNGPFDFERYNSDGCNYDETLDAYTAIPGAKNRFFSVRRPTPADYGGQAQATKGVQVEILDGATPCNKGQVISYDSLGNQTITPAANGGISFTDPDKLNRLGDQDNPVNIKSSELHYRVRFVYPVDSLVDGSTQTVDPAKHYLLDTPVFDDISVTYFLPPRILDMREVAE